MPTSIAVGGAAGAAALALVRRRRILAGAGLVACVFGLAAAGTALRSRPAALESIASQVPECRFEGHVVERAGGLGTLIAIDAASCDGFMGLTDAGVVIVDAHTADPGSRVVLRGLLVPLRSDGFDAIRRRAGANAWMHDPEIELAARPTGIFAIAAALRASLRRATADLDPSAAGLLEGLSIGRTDGLDRIDQEHLRRAGLSHLVAVSGSNVALILGCAVLLAARAAPWARVASGLGALVLYVALVGPEPSVLRAALMGAIALFALGLGRRTVSLQTLALALMGVLAFRPQLVGSVGLQLSAAATGGIILWAGSIAERVRAPRPVSLVLGATLAAQVAVAPVLIAVFGRLSVVAPLSNLLAISAVAPATILGLGAALVGLLSDTAARALAGLAAPFVHWILFVGSWLGSQTWAEVEIPRAAWPPAALAVVLFAAKTLKQKERAKPR
ncbi:MAG: ComEC/Rec2 family competence protein [Actinomycetota bacterium]